jgi:hypothetical protein
MVTMPEELITTALQRAFWAPPPTRSLLHHPKKDRSFQILLDLTKSRFLFV